MTIESFENVLIYFYGKFFRKIFSKIFRKLFGEICRIFKGISFVLSWTTKHNTILREHTVSPIILRVHWRITVWKRRDLGGIGKRETVEEKKKKKEERIERHVVAFGHG